MRPFIEGSKTFFAFVIWPYGLWEIRSVLPKHLRSGMLFSVFWTFVIVGIWVALSYYTHSLWLKIPSALVALICYAIAGVFITVAVIDALTPREDY